MIDWAELGASASALPDARRDRERRVTELARDVVGAPYLRGHFALSSRARINYDFDKFPFETKPGILPVPPQTDRIGGWTSASDVARGVDVLYETVLRLDTLPASLGPASAGVNA